jgi:hypothetical protein
MMQLPLSLLKAAQKQPMVSISCVCVCCSSVVVGIVVDDVRGVIENQMACHFFWRLAFFKTKTPPQQIL